MITVEQARGLYHDNDTAHGFDHVMRVWRLAMRIGATEGADLEILSAAALLHDAGRAEQDRTGMCHALLGAEIARQVLAGQGREQVEAVALAIEQHRFRSTNPPVSIEARVLYDADKLDAMGASGVARAYALAGARRQRLWAKVEQGYAERAPEEGQADLEADGHTPVHEYLFKLAKLRDRMLTETGKGMAEERHNFMAQFFARLEQEVEGTS
jgi:uncharacterized protein